MGSLISALARAVRAVILSLPAPLRYFLSLLAFWPTVALNRFICFWWPHKRKLWNRVSDTIVLGAAPLYQSEVRRLIEEVREHRAFDWKANVS
jgi:hypothetical protein